jgi:hypothetical protein
LTARDPGDEHWRPDEAERVHAWRTQQFLALGFTLLVAELLDEAGVDLRYAEHVVREQGCPPDVAVRILL